MTQYQTFSVWYRRDKGQRLQVVTVRARSKTLAGRRWLYVAKQKGWVVRVVDVV